MSKTHFRPPIVTDLYLPLSGIISLQGKAKGVMECWQTNAVKLPVTPEGCVKKRKEKKVR